MNNITSFFAKKKSELAIILMMEMISKNNMNLELSFAKASDGDVFKDSLKSKNCILILKKCIENIEKKIEL